MFYYVIAKDLAHALVGPFLSEQLANEHVTACEATLPAGMMGSEYTVKPANEINLWDEGIDMLNSPKDDLEFLKKCMSEEFAEGG